MLGRKRFLVSTNPSLWGRDLHMVIVARDDLVERIAVHLHRGWGCFGSGLAGASSRGWMDSACGRDGRYQRNSWQLAPEVERSVTVAGHNGSVPGYDACLPAAPKLRGDLMLGRACAVPIHLRHVLQVCLHTYV
jgi:hypothetical protein